MRQNVRITRVENVADEQSGRLRAKACLSAAFRLWSRAAEELQGRRGGMGMIANSVRWQPYDLAYQVVDLDFLGVGAEGRGTSRFSVLLSASCAGV